MSAQWDAPAEGDVLQPPESRVRAWLDKPNVALTIIALAVVVGLSGFVVGVFLLLSDHDITVTVPGASPVPVTAGPVEVSQPLDVGDWTVSYVSVEPWAGGAIVSAHVVNKGDQELLDGKFTLTLINRATGATVATLHGEAYFVDPGKGADVVFFPTQVVAADAYADLANGGPPYGYRIAVQP